MTTVTVYVQIGERPLDRVGAVELKDREDAAEDVAGLLRRLADEVERP